MAVSVNQWVNPCGGLPWRTLADGRIEVQGQGVPNWAPASSQRKYLVQTWTNWKPAFEAAAKKFGLQASWLVAIATMETGLWSGKPAQQATIASEDGYGSIGVMQPLVMVATMYGYQPAERADPAKNIDMGAHLLYDDWRTKNGQAGGFPVVAAMFNGGAGSGGCNPGNDVFNLKGYRGPGWPTAVYASNAIRYQNTARELGIGASAASGSLTYALAGAALVAVGALALGVVRFK